MPVLTVYRHGVTAGVSPMAKSHPPALRGDVNGWSAGAVRRNLKFLYSIDERGLTGRGYALTLTVRNCPPSHEDWRRVVKNYLQQISRTLRTVRAHWVTEWQRRGVPHLHAAVWLPDDATDPSQEMVRLWLHYAAAYSPGTKGQMVKPINGPVGWFQYVSKHAARGLQHYQRAAANMPTQWAKSGRMWGTGGDWPIREPVKLMLSNRGYHVLRRWARSWRVADARARHADTRRKLNDEGRIDQPLLRAYLETRRRIHSARTMLRCPDPQLSRVRGISEWIDESQILRMISQLHHYGYPVDS